MPSGTTWSRCRFYETVGSLESSEERCVSETERSWCAIPCNETTRSGERGRGCRTLILPAGRDPPAHHTCLVKSGVAGKPCKEGGLFFTGQPPPHSFKTPTVRVSRPSASSRAPASRASASSAAPSQRQLHPGRVLEILDIN